MITFPFWAKDRPRIHQKWGTCKTNWFEASALGNLILMPIRFNYSWKLLDNRDILASENKLFILTRKCHQEPFESKASACSSLTHNTAALQQPFAGTSRPSLDPWVGGRVAKVKGFLKAKPPTTWFEKLCENKIWHQICRQIIRVAESKHSDVCPLYQTYSLKSQVIFICSKQLL